MAAATSSALRVALATFLYLSLVGGSNVTESSMNSTTNHTGWHNGPAERGTMNLIWSCLTTVIACTWTILHLNVPGPLDGTWTKFWRKVKWMAITVIFPEFIFAKAVCELQMAVDDLRALSIEQEKFGWDVEYNRGCQLLYKLLHPWDTVKRSWRSTAENSGTRAVGGSQPMATEILNLEQAEINISREDTASGLSQPEEKPGLGSWGTLYTGEKRK
jgi:hypothetical protein